MLPTAGMLTRNMGTAGEEPGCRELGLEVAFDFKAAHGTNISPSPTRSSESQARTEGAGRDESGSAGVRPELTWGLCTYWVRVCRGWHCHPIAGDSTEPLTQPQGVAGPTCQGGRGGPGPSSCLQIKRNNSNALPSGRHTAGTNSGVPPGWGLLGLSPTQVWAQNP